MINKSKLWFITLFSLVLVLGVYYITMPSTLLKSANDVNLKTKKVNMTVSDADIFLALRASRDEELVKSMEEKESILTSSEATNEEKNDAYEELKNLNLTKGKEESLEQMLIKDYDTKAFVKITGDNISVVMKKEKHDTKLANEIMRKIQSKYDKKMYITVKFEK